MSFIIGPLAWTCDNIKGIWAWKCQSHIICPYLTTDGFEYFPIHNHLLSCKGQYLPSTVWWPLNHLHDNRAMRCGWKPQKNTCEWILCWELFDTLTLRFGCSGNVLSFITGIRNWKKFFWTQSCHVTCNSDLRLCGFKWDFLEHLTLLLWKDWAEITVPFELQWSFASLLL